MDPDVKQQINELNASWVRYAKTALGEHWSLLWMCQFYSSHMANIDTERQLLGS